MSDHAAPPFAGVLAPVAERSLQRLRTRIGEGAGCLTGPALESLTRHLITRLSEVTGQVLFCAFASYRSGAPGNDASSPTGVDPARRAELFERWERSLRSGGWTRLLDEFPEMRRLIGVVTSSWEETSAELVRRISRDRELLERTFGGSGPAGPVVRVDAGLSDPHAGGRTVCRVAFASGLEVVYKPREVATERLFAELVAWLNRRGLHPPLHAVRTCEREGYGWAAYVPNRECADEVAVHEFYRRAGALVCLLDVLGATDIHYGNVIAAGPHPVVVDLETVLHPLHPTDEPDGSRKAAGSSVLTTGLVPRWSSVVADGPGYDVSGLGAVAPRTTDVPGIAWVDADTDALELRKRGIPISRLVNAPLLHGEPVFPADFTDDILRGFDETHRLVSGLAADLRAPHGPLEPFGGARTRVLLRHTVTYRAWLEASLRPDCLRDGRIREEEIGGRVAPQVGPARAVQFEEQRAQAELDALLRLDIPRFTTRPNDVYLEEAAGSRLEQWFDAPRMKRVLERLGTMDAADRLDRIRLLKTTMDLAALQRLMPGG